MLADACAEAACRLAREKAEARHGVPSGRDGRPARFVVLALGKLGGEELNYSSDIDLIFLYDVEGQTAGPRAVSNAEFFARMGGEIVRLLVRPHRARRGLPGRHAAPARGGPGAPWPVRSPRPSAITRRPAGPGSARP